MKKVISLIVVVAVLSLTIINVFATNDLVYKYDNISVCFESDTEYTEEERQYIADMLVYGESNITPIQPRAWCWLTGHDKTTEYVTIITHKKYATDPRCLKELYEVTTCANCDLYDMVLVSSVDIVCCEED